MKIRSDFVTNSSSSSFIIAKKYLDEDQINAIRNHQDLARKIGMLLPLEHTGWNIDENEDFIAGYARMDSFSMNTFLNVVDIHDEDILWGESLFHLEDYIAPPDKTIIDWRKLLHEDPN